MAGRYHGEEQLVEAGPLHQLLSRCQRAASLVGRPSMIVFNLVTLLVIATSSITGRGWSNSGVPIILMNLFSFGHLSLRLKNHSYIRAVYLKLRSE